MKSRILITAIVSIVILICVLFIKFNFINESKTTQHLQNKLLSSKTHVAKNFNLDFNSLVIEKQIDREDIRVYIYSITSKKLNKKIYGHAVYRKHELINRYELIAIGEGTEPISYSQYMINKDRYLILLYGVNTNNRKSIINFQVNNKIFKENIKDEQVFVRIYKSDRESNIRLIEQNQWNKGKVFGMGLFPISIIDIFGYIN
ncbi:hypothetical protein [Paramaledivibacter caminithermalis]|uniref:Uncharacterized protein n=1 Tax=Paramaledivibacter caminithermalis (strain DSM 15212 / CIP 107654 / DViRD3) TaxID=1121301 RepID=A0A1M6RMA7_PARC5|nr:hypothetical protein [Paramaledivibacter caminithermalis]SHK33566.1 hypothetical protein SAMN02745912_03020 [Paramaledivibacter caminithermalis DSM 15212]